MRHPATGPSRAVALVAAVVTVAVSGCGRAAPAAPPPPRALAAIRPIAEPVPADPRVGALFLGGRDVHSCTGAVLDSAAGNLIVTAAHCLPGGVDGWFVPGFAGAAAPEAFWHVDAVYLDARWIDGQQRSADFAVARVSRDAGGTVEAAAGGGFGLGTTPERGRPLRTVGYPLGEGGPPIGCTGVGAGRWHGYPSLRCAGMVGGTSGAPLIDGAGVVGVIGGLDGGGCLADVSYSSPFDGAVHDLLARAQAGAPDDARPSTYSDGC